MAEKDAESLTAHVMQSQPAAEKSPRRLPPKRDKREANSALSAEAWAHRHEAASVKLVNDRSASCTSSLLQPYSRPSVTDTTSARLFHGLKKPPTASNTSPALFSLIDCSAQPNRTLGIWHWSRKSKYVSNPGGGGGRPEAEAAREPEAVEATTSSPADHHHDDTSCTSPVARHLAHPFAASSKRASDGKALANAMSDQSPLAKIRLPGSNAIPTWAKKCSRDQSLRHHSKGLISDAFAWVCGWTGNDIIRASATRKGADLDSARPSCSMILKTASTPGDCRNATSKDQRLGTASRVRLAFRATSL